MADQPTRQGQAPIGGDNAPRGNLPADLAGAGPSGNAKQYAWPDTPSLLSTRVKRVDGPDKVTGRATFTYDIQRPGMLYAVTVRSPHLHAKVLSVDLSETRIAPGVKAVLTTKEPGSEVRYQGDLVAAIAADTEERARDAARLARVQYKVLPHVSQEDRAMAPDAPQVFQGGNTRAGTVLEVGDLAAGFNAAAHVVEGTYSTHVITHVCLETHGAVCEWNGDTLTAWVSTQGVHSSRQQFAQALKIPEANVRVSSRAYKFRECHFGHLRDGYVYTPRNANRGKLLFGHSSCT